MAKVRVSDNAIVYMCPAEGCGWHRLDRKRWKLTGTVDAPTIHPSLIAEVNPKDHPDHNPECPTTRCHSIIRKGKITFLNDCTHNLRGKTVDMEDIE